MTTTLDQRNRLSFGIGTFGRDACYAMVSMFLVFYLTDIIKVTGPTLVATTIVMVFARVFDAASDPFIGVLVDNTRSRFGKFKPWIVGGALGFSVLLVVLFSDLGLQGAQFVFAFLIIYLTWGIFFTSNDVGYWSMLPALSQSQEQRERIGSLARIFGSLGAFAMVVGIIPITEAIAKVTGSLPQAYTILAAGTVVVMLAFQSITVIFSQEDPTIIRTEEKTRFKDLVHIIFKNDQLVAVAASMTLFTLAYTTTISLGVYYFKYVFGNEGMYPVFAVVLGVAQISTLSAYPLVARRMPREKIYTVAMILVVVGYVGFFFAPTSTMVFVVIAGLALFIGQALIQMLILMFITDSVEYGQWKLGIRNESVILSIQPLINKTASALASGVVGATVILAHTQTVPKGHVLAGQDLLTFKVAMMGLPLLLIAGSYVIYRRYYRIDASLYRSMVEDLRARAGEASGAIQS